MNSMGKIGRSILSDIESQHFQDAEELFPGGALGGNSLAPDARFVFKNTGTSNHQKWLIGTTQIRTNAGRIVGHGLVPTAHDRAELRRNKSIIRKGHSEAVSPTG